MNSKYETLAEGRYSAQIKDWGVREVPALKTVEAFIQFEFKEGDETYALTWKGLFLKKDGSPNKKTYDTLKTCGFTGKNIEALTTTGSLDNMKTYDITLKRENGFINVEWVNDPNAVASGRVSDVKTLAGYDLSKINGELAKMNMSEPAKRVIKNHAPGGVDIEEKLPF